jgi:cytochrome P450/NADPH-cytochrome P450 reductase
LIDDRLADCGAERLCDRGEGNAAVAELFDQFDDWEAGFLERAGGQANDSDGPGLTADIDSEIRKNLLQQQSLLSCKVISNEVISKGDVDIKRKIVLELPEGVEYRTGDYIGLLPANPIPVIQRVLGRFGLHMDDVVTLHGTAGAWTLPLDVPISAFDLLAAFVELESPVTLKQVEKLKSYAAKESQELARLEEYCKPDVFKAEIGDKRVDLLSLVEELERLDMPFTDFLIAMPSIKMRQVSRRRRVLNQAATWYCDTDRHCTP